MLEDTFFGKPQPHIVDAILRYGIHLTFRQFHLVVEIRVHVQLASQRIVNGKTFTVETYQYVAFMVSIQRWHRIIARSIDVHELVALFPVESPIGSASLDIVRHVGTDAVDPDSCYVAHERRHTLVIVAIDTVFGSYP